MKRLMDANVWRCHRSYSIAFPNPNRSAGDPPSNCRSFHAIFRSLVKSKSMNCFGHSFAFGLLLLLAWLPRWAAAAEVDFIVGDYMPAEDGQWDPDQSPLTNPFGIDFDANDNMYVVELAGGRIHQIDPAGRITHFSGDGSKSYSGDGGPAKDAKYNGMHNCAITHDDQLLIADSWNHCVRRIELGSKQTETLIGTGVAGFGGDDGPASDATFNFVMCIALNDDKTVLHIVDLKNRRVRDVDLASGVVSTVAGNGKKGIPDDGTRAADSPLVDPRAAASDANDNLYILERGGHALRVVRPNGTIQTVAGNGQKGYRDGVALQAQFGAPKHLCVDDLGRVYIADDLNGAIRRYDPTAGQVETVLGQGNGDRRIRLLHPHGVAIHNDALYVVDSGNHRILRILIDELSGQ